ncbi:hypothetical protein QA597_03060 [Marinilabiliaceae bacterium ANBcel2]|nr:hypothetical protein [Marinilabiliaceae bacterium ANBcel2]
MIGDYQKTILQIRGEICSRLYKKKLYSNYRNIYKSEKELVKKAESRLKKTLLFDVSMSDKSVITLFDEVNKVAKGSEMRIQLLLFLSLKYRIGCNLILCLEECYKELSGEDIKLKRLKAEEKRIKKEYEKQLYDIDDPVAHNIIPFSFKVGDLKHDLSVISELVTIGEEASEYFSSMKKIIRDLELNSETSLELDKAFDLFVKASCSIILFRTRIGEVRDNRNFNLHLESLNGFTDIFLNSFILDKLEEGRVKSSYIYLRKVHNSLEAVLKGIKTKLIKAEGELTITMNELNAITKRVEKEK